MLPLSPITIFYPLSCILYLLCFNFREIPSCFQLPGVYHLSLLLICNCLVVLLSPPSLFIIDRCLIFLTFKLVISIFACFLFLLVISSTVIFISHHFFIFFQFYYWFFFVDFIVTTSYLCMVCTSGLSFFWVMCGVCDRLCAFEWNLMANNLYKWGFSPHIHVFPVSSDVKSFQEVCTGYVCWHPESTSTSVSSKTYAHSWHSTETSYVGFSIEVEKYSNIPYLGLIYSVLFYLKWPFLL